MHQQAYRQLQPHYMNQYVSLTTVAFAGNATDFCTASFIFIKSVK